jgi:hypothetical protein
MVAVQNFCESGPYFQKASIRHILVKNCCANIEKEGLERQNKIMSGTP